MYALTLTQPYATLVMLCQKRIETRGWSTTLRGRFAIHAGSGLGPVGGMRGLIELLGREPFNSALWATYQTAEPAELAELLPRGAVLGSVELFDSSPIAMQGALGCYYVPRFVSWVRLDARETAFGDYRAGRYGFRLRDPRPLATPIPLRGYQKFWTLPADVAQQMR